MKSEKTAQIVKDWYGSIAQGDMEAVMDGLSEDVVFDLPQNDYNKIIPYMGTHTGREEIAESFRVRGECTEVEDYKTLEVVAQGNVAYVAIYTKAYHIRTKKEFVVEDVHRVELNEDGKVIRGKIYFDPTEEMAAFEVDIEEQLIAAVGDNDIDKTRYLLDVGASPDARDAESGLTALMMASGQSNPQLAEALLDAGADVFAADSKAGASALHKACQGGSLEVAKLLVEAGVFVDAVAPTTGHTPLIEALWFKWPDIVEYLLEQGAGLNMHTHYGFTLLEHFNYAMKVNVYGKEKLLQADKMLKARQKSDQDKAESQKLMEAVTEGDLEGVKKLIAEGVDIEERYPILNGFNDYHTPLLVACRDGHTEIVAELLKAGADMNAVEPTFIAVPLHKATYNGHADITQMLVKQPGININFQGATNGYTPLHDALWHGYDDCARILIEAGACLDLKGNDGLTPLDIAADVFGSDHEIVQLIQSKMEA